MSALSSTSQASAPAGKPYCPVEWAQKQLKPFLVPYYLTVGGVLGAITVGFVVITVLLILVVANFNVLSLIE